MRLGRRERRAEHFRLFASGLLWAPVAAAASRAGHVWLPALLALALVLVCGLWPDWRRPGDRVAWVLSYSALFVWSWSQGQPQSGASQEAYWSGMALLAALAGWSVAGGRLPSLWAVPVVAIGVAVSFFSGPEGGADPWLRFFREVLGLQPDAAQAALAWSRKSTHFFGYGVFAFCAYRLARTQGLAPRAAFGAAIAWVGPHAVFDEADQVFAGNRNGSLLDVVLDMSGACALAGLACWRDRRA